MIDDLWYRNGVFYCRAAGTYMDANGDGIGDFRGLLRWLDHRQGLDITTIRLMPFQPSPGGLHYLLKRSDIDTEAGPNDAHPA